MIETATAINTLPSARQVDFESNSEQLITLTYSQLQDLIVRAVQEGIQPLQDEISQLREEIDQDRREIAALRAGLASQEATQEQDANRICLDIAYDRRRLTALESRATGAAPTPGDKTAARIAKLKEFLKARGGGATFHEVEKLLGIRPNQMTKLVSQLDKRSFEVFTRSGDGRQRVLRLKTQIVSRER